MKKFIFLILLTVSSVSWGATPARLTKKGKIDLAYGNINGSIFWNQASFDSTLSSLTAFSSSTVTSFLYIPTQFELSLATCTLYGFYALDDYYGAQTQTGIMPYLDELYIRIKTLSDSSQNSKAIKFQSNYDYLSSMAKTLP